MKSTIFFLLFMLTGTVFFTGCYTQLGMAGRTPAPAETVEWVVDSATGDTVKVVKQVDTIRVEDRQTCVWERDLMGYPVLRCYDSFYPRDWFWYNNTPWWYRNDPYWYDYDRCPRYYYYDHSCGCCRYTGSNYNHRYYDRYPDKGKSEVKNEPSGPGGSTIYPRGYDVPSSGKAVPANKGVTSKGGGSTQGSTSKSADAHNTKTGSSTTTPVPNSEVQQPEKSDHKSDRRNPRSW